MTFYAFLTGLYKSFEGACGASPVSTPLQDTVGLDEVEPRVQVPGGAGPCGYEERSAFIVLKRVTYKGLRFVQAQIHFIEPFNDYSLSLYQDDDVLTMMYYDDIVHRPHTITAS